KHYRVAVLAADGNYDLEKGNNRGDGGDAHHAAGVDAMTTGPGGDPNTDAYQGGNIINTGHTISNISASGPSMSFCLGSCSALSAPSALNATAASSTSINLVWTDNSSTETGFSIEHSLNGSTWSVEGTVGTDVTVYVDTGLTPGSTHYYRLRAFDGSNNSGWSNIASATTDQVAPDAPSGLLAVAQSDSRIDLSWADNANNEDSYRVERGTDGVSFATLTSLPANSTAYSNTGLSASQTYFYRVVAVNTAGMAASGIASATTDAPPPLVDYVAYADVFGSGTMQGTYANTHTDDGIDQQFTEQTSGGRKDQRTTYMDHFWRFNINGGDEVTLFTNAWRSATSDNDNFIFAWSDDNITYHDLFTVSSQSGSNTQSATIPNSVSGQVWIRVIDTDRTPGNSSSLDSLFVDHLYIRVINNGPPAAPNAPDGLLAITAGKTSIDLSWTDNSNNENGFRIERSLDGSNWSPLVAVGINAEAHSDTGLTPDTTYFYRVLAYNGVGDSGWSASASATTDPDLPVTFSLSAVGGTSKGKHVIDLSWSGASATNVDIYRDGGIVATTANDGVYSDATGSKTRGAVYTHKVCEQGSSTVCSNETVTSY
ncbi:MAG TPA: fibronectin type III domain-containing protein, partial [Xanthomonadales bacterium]